MSQAAPVDANTGGGGVTSRLSKELTQKQRITINVGSFYRGQSYDDGMFGIYGVPAPGVSLETVEAELQPAEQGGGRQEQAGGDARHLEGGAEHARQRDQSRPGHPALADEGARAHGRSSPAASGAPASGSRAGPT